MNDMRLCHLSGTNLAVDITLLKVLNVQKLDRQLCHYKALLVYASFVVFKYFCPLRVYINLLFLATKM